MKQFDAASVGVPSGRRAKKFVIAVAGNPNCGKSTLFNGLTGAAQQIGNWPGVTVEKKEGRLQDSGGADVKIVDLPGVYNLSAFSEDERASRDFLLSGEPDLVLNVIDATNLERNLYLTLQLLEMGLPVVAVLTMKDLFDQSGSKLDADGLSRLLGCPVVAVNATSAADIGRVRAHVRHWVDATPAGGNGDVCVYDRRIEEVISEWEPALAEIGARIRVSARWLAVKALEQDDWVASVIESSGTIDPAVVRARAEALAIELDEAPDVLTADAKYGRIQRVVSVVVHRHHDRERAEDRLDRILMHRIWGIPIFLVAMFGVFWVTINVGGVFIPFFDGISKALFVDGTAYLLDGIGAPQWLTTILSGGIGTGIETVATFIPVIFFMFLMLSLLEDSGYMARSAFVTDRLMGRIGLPGKAFVPLIVGFGCTVPAIMATRTLDNRRDRILTIFMAPLMSCGARLPVYALFAAAFFPAGSGLVVFSLYLVGILLAVMTGLLLRQSIFRGEQTHLLMELPPYHRPRFGSVMIYTWDRVKLFIFRAGKVVILGITILSFFNSLGIDGSFGNENTGKSVLSTVGKTITPVFSPMGIERDNWPATVAIFSGVFAKEAVVGTITSLYSEVDRPGSSSADGSAGSPATFDLLREMEAAVATVPPAAAQLFSGMAGATGSSPTGTSSRVFASLHRHFSGGPLEAYAYLLFILIYLPCLATMGTAMREMGALYSVAMGVYLTAVAWILATLFYQVAIGGSLVWIAVAALLGLAVVGGFYLTGRMSGKGARLGHS